MSAEDEFDPDAEIRRLAAELIKRVEQEPVPERMRSLVRELQTALNKKTGRMN